MMALNARLSGCRSARSRTRYAAFGGTASWPRSTRKLALGVIRQLSEGIAPRLGESAKPPPSPRRPRRAAHGISSTTSACSQACFPILVQVPPEHHQPGDPMAIVDVEKLRTIADVVDGVAQALDRQRR